MAYFQSPSLPLKCYLDKAVSGAGHLCRGVTVGAAAVWRGGGCSDFIELLPRQRRSVRLEHEALHPHQSAPAPSQGRPRHHLLTHAILHLRISYFQIPPTETSLWVNMVCRASHPGNTGLHCCRRVFYWRNKLDLNLLLTCSSPYKARWQEDPLPGSAVLKSPAALGRDTKGAESHDLFS